MSQELVLLARTPNGDAAFVRDADGAVWFLDPHRSRLSNEEEMRRAVRNLDFVEVGSTHLDWPDVGRALDEAAAAWRKGRSWPGVESYSIETLLDILQDVEFTDVDTQDVALTLLSECPAAKDDVVYHRILELLRARPAATNTQTSANNAVARQRVLQRLAG